MAWRKYFKVANTTGQLSPIGGSARSNKEALGFSNYGSILPQTYLGAPNRVERYNQYENMDMDAELNSALDILAEFCTQLNEENNTAFEVKFKDRPTDTEAKILDKELSAWCKLNQFDKRIFKMFRNVLKYGDQVFLRDPETFKLFWTEMNNVVKIIVNESNGKEPEQYVFRNLNPNFENLTVTQVTTDNMFGMNPNVGAGTGGTSTYNPPSSPFSGNSRFTHGLNERTVDAEHVVHLSLTEGLDANWPFGNSILELVYKVYKQKELLEDAIIIYRIQRAPERRVFYIDVGNMPSHMAMAFVDRIKNELHQRRIPTQANGQGASYVDSTSQAQCLDLLTKIPLLDGRTLTLSELIAEYQAGKKNWAYSCDPTNGKIVPGPITWAGITRKNTNVLKLTLDNGKELIITPDHKIPVLNKGFVEAQNLTVDDCLIAFNIREKSIDNRKSSHNYVQIFDHNKNKWLFVHRIVANFFRKLRIENIKVFNNEFKDLDKNTIHHNDFNRYNNNPENLIFVNKLDHAKYHTSNAGLFWNNATDEQKLLYQKKQSNSLKNYWKNLSVEEKENKLVNTRNAQKIAVFLRKNDETVKQKYFKNASISRKKYFSKHPAFKEFLINQLNKIRHPFKPQETIFTDEMFSRVVDKIKSGIVKKHEVISACDNDFILLDMFAKDNPMVVGPSVTSNVDYSKWGYSKLKKIIKIYGYTSWKDFVSKAKYFNHRITKIEYLENLMDVGTITIDGDEKYHNFHTFAVESGIFVKNSIQQDFFFPVGADGRGSKVETLPSGQNLGEIDDLRYFTNKLLRGLRIPSSYLPTGHDDSDITDNDGRLGTALIQEFRFNQYCQRLQMLIGSTLDTEFKAYLKWRGLTIDTSLFDLKFNPPQNFAYYRQAELDTTRIQAFSQVEQIPYLSKRWKLKRYLGLTEAEMAENDEMWKEEQQQLNSSEDENINSQEPELRDIGISPGSIDANLESLGDIGSAEEGNMPGGEGGVPGAGNLAGEASIGGAGSAGAQAPNTPSGELG